MNNEELLKIEYLAKKYDETNIPLYLSYPVESWWRTHVDKKMYAECFYKAENPFLYFHFPYCNNGCYYCACYKDVIKTEEDNDVYIQHLIDEFNHKLSLFGMKSFKNVRHLHWGGGTPTLLGIRQMEKIQNSIMSKIDFDNDSDKSISLEAYPDPEVVTVEKLKLLRNLGFNEISIGVQDLDERVQNAINRCYKRSDIEKLVDACKKEGFRVHIDLCYGLPLQGIREIEESVTGVLKMKPDRVAFFPYTHYPIMFPMQKKLPYESIPNSFMKVIMKKAAEDIFASEGYRGVGTDHFVTEDNSLYKALLNKQVIKDFMGYSVNQRKNLLGFGKGAISFLDRHYFHNDVNLETYFSLIDRGQIPLQAGTGHFLSNDDIIRNNVIQKGILSDFCVDKTEINKEFGINFDDYFSYEADALQKCAKDGMVELDCQGVIKITPYGKLFARHIAYIFDSYYRKK